MSENFNNRGTSGLAIGSLVLGIVTLLMFWIPILHLLPGVLAVVLGIVGLMMIRRGTVSGAGLAVSGIVCATLGMLPTVLILMAFIGIGASEGFHEVKVQVGDQSVAVASEIPLEPLGAPQMAPSAPK
jgi:hypothetical protein